MLLLKKIFLNIRLCLFSLRVFLIYLVPLMEMCKVLLALPLCLFLVLILMVNCPVILLLSLVLMQLFVLVCVVMLSVW